MIDKQPGLWIYPDGREVIQRGSAGRKIMDERWNKAWSDCKGTCCLCEQYLLLYDATLEHLLPKGSGGSKHDDRQANLGMSHRKGNSAKGSISYERYMQLPLEVRIANCRGMA